MRRLTGLLLVALALSACVSDQMNQGLGFMVGQNIQTAVSRLGYPDAQRTMLGDTIYVWSTNHQVDLPMTTTSTIMGNVGTVPVYGTAMGTTYVPANFNCTIQLGVGPGDIIKNWQWTGNMGGCARYANALSQRASP
jgi:hypothetical protein